jgi:hypothetical protein
MNETYPLTYSVDYPEEELNRLTTFFRLFMLIPIGIVLAAVNHATFGGWGDNAATYVGAGGLLVLGPLLMILFVGKYPRWWFDWNRELLRFINRVSIYGALLRDEYPSTDEQQALRLDFPYPNVESDLSRGMVLVKWFLAIPHYFVLVFLYIAAVVCVIIAWFAILFTGRYPRGLFEFVVGVHRWANRVVAYALILVTDKYPPFSLREETGTSSTGTPPA